MLNNYSDLRLMTGESFSKWLLDNTNVGNIAKVSVDSHDFIA